MLSTTVPVKTTTPAEAVTLVANTTLPSTTRPNTTNPSTTRPVENTTTPPSNSVLNNIVKLVKQNISGPAKAYSDTHYYQSFELDINTAENVFANIGTTSSKAFGVISTNTQVVSGETTEMILFDDNLYDYSTAQYAIETFYTQKLWEQHDYFNSHLSAYSIRPGLSYAMYNKVMVSPDTSTRSWDVNYFSKQIRDEVTPITKGTTTDMSSLKTALSGFNLSTINTNFYVEWFGYFCPKTSGMYEFQINSPDIVNIWVGNNALTDFTVDNSFKLDQKIAMTGGSYYPIRIHYGMSVTSVITNLQLKISIFLNNEFLTNGAGYLFSIFDKTGVPYEPIQLHYALTQYTNSAKQSGLYNLYYTKLNIVNNYLMNQYLRIAKTNINTITNSIIIAQCSTTDLPCTFFIQDDGNVVLKNNSSSVQITHFTSQESGVNFGSCKGGNKFQNTPIITLNGYSINSYYTITQESRVDMSTGLSYDNYVYKNFNYTGNQNEPLYSIISGNQNSNFTIVIDYVLGNEHIIETLNQPLTRPINISNLNKVANCTFVLELQKGGDITLRNYNKRIWNLFGDTMNTNSVQKIKQLITYAVPNNDWIYEYQVAYNNGINLSYLFEGEELDKETSLYTSDGICKLAVQGNQLVLNVMTSPFKNKQYTDNNDPPNSFFLFSAIGDMKFNTNMMVDMTNNTLQYVPVGGNILKYRNEFKRPISNEYSFPPFTNDTVLADGYQKYENADNETCQNNCTMNPQCNHYYSYNLEDGSSHCVINIDGSLPKYLPKKANSGIKNSNMYIRQKYISSDCKINTYLPTYSSNLATTEQYNVYQNFVYGNNKYDPDPSQEGACGVDSISKNLNMFEYGSYSAPSSINTMSTSPPPYQPIKEGFENIATTAPRTMADIEVTTPPSGIPGFNTNICNSLNKPQCLSEMQSNLNVLNNYYNNINQSNNNKIFKNYTNLQHEIYDEFIQKYNKINVNAAYDPIDNTGQLLNDKFDKSLLSGMIYDIKQRMMSENTKNILINLLSASIFVAILALAP